MNAEQAINRAEKIVQELRARGGGTAVCHDRNEDIAALSFTMHVAAISNEPFGIATKVGTQAAIKIYAQALFYMGWIAANEEDDLSMWESHLSEEEK